MVAFISLILPSRSSCGLHNVGNLPALFRPGPSRRGICLIKLSEATNAWYFFGEFLDQLLVLVEVLEALSILELKAERSGLFAMVRIAEDADAHLWAGNVRQLDVARETLVLLRIVLLKANLELNRLNEVTLLLSSASEHILDAFPELVSRYL